MTARFQKPLSRRYAVKLGIGSTLGLSATSTLFSPAKKALAEGEDPHFFIYVCMAGGVDPTYWFDGRPLDMTDAGIVSNYLYRNSETEKNTVAGQRIDYVGQNGGKCIRTTLTEPLMKYKDDFTIINGIVMNGPGIAGHGQNMYTFFTGKNVGGYDSFVPMIGQANKNPIESFHVGGWKGDGNTAPKNFGGSVQVDGYSSLALFDDIKESSGFDPADPVSKFLLDRYAARSKGNDAFALGCGSLSDGLANAPRLNNALIEAASTQANSQAKGALLTAMAMTHRLFSGGVTSAVTIMMDRDMGSSFDIDAHSATIAKSLPKNYADIITDLVALIDYLKNNEYKAGKSLFDVTTLMIGSEFGRPYRQLSLPIWNTGTDHNQLINSMIIMGKGIKPGQVIGASDLETVDAAKDENISGAHKAAESTAAQGGSCLMPMGKPFDFENGVSRTDKPAQFNIRDYLTIQSVTNTLLRHFGYSDDKMFRDPDGLQFQTIEKHLLKTS